MVIKLKQIGIIRYSNLEYFIKIMVISAFTLKLNYKILGIHEKSVLNVVKLAIILICSNVICAMIEDVTNSTISVLFLDIFVSLILSYKINNNLGYSVLVSTISLSINYVIYLISVIINFIIFRTLNISNEQIALISILIIFSVLVMILCNVKRVKNGVTFLKNNENNEYLGMFILNISYVVFLAIIVLNSIDKRSILIYVIIFSIIMFISIQKSLQLYYKQKLQERETAEIKEELNSKAKEIEELEKENLRLSKANHSILHKQKSLEYELSQALLKNETMDKKEIKTKLQDISKEIPKETAPIELTKTNIKEIDNMLKYMQAECTKNKIDFELQINVNIHHMINKYIGKEELEILLADHIKNAIIAINHSNNINKNILVRLGIIDGLYSLYIYDSGIEFEVETLKNLGIKPSTTHADDGGTGMGFMNTFDTLKKYNASMEIHEYGKPSKDNFTKVIKIIFNNKHEYKISSYREKEIL